MLRNWSDKSTVLARLEQHPWLKPSKHRTRSFDISCKDGPTSDLLTLFSRYAPLSELATERLRVQAIPAAHPVHEQWLGVQQGCELSLFYPAFRDASTLAFTFFHEYAHWLQKQEALVPDGTWEAYLACREVGSITVESESDLAQLWEEFANDLAWFCTNPTYLDITRKRVRELFTRVCARNSC